MKKLLGHIAHLEITAPDAEKSANFYVERFGMRIVDRRGDRIYLRCWGDYYRYSLVIAPGAEASLATMAWRVDYSEALDELVGRLDERGISGVWRDDLPAVGRAYEFVGPFGHSMTLFWEVEPFTTDPEFASVYPDRPERRAVHGAAPRFLDHVTVASTDVEGFAAWYSEALGFRVMAKTYLDHAPVNVFTVLTTNEKSHDLGIVLDTSGVPGRVHHIAFWTDHPEDLVRTADLMLESSVPIEYGPSIHGIGEQNYLYFREPSGLRVEVNSGGYRNYVPDWEARRWTPSVGSNNFFKNWNMPDSMMEAFPAASGMTATEDGASPQLEEALTNPWSTTTGTA
ncbi:VOC family protein [Herbiconiux sp.]|jgi:catechol 2,3-dioxygenase|uniref:VOC family protein n=1 Tax=Herbiconiux sp. TaxID=1871186 RepID=UPI0025C24DC1|nr:VOC family protein [Herbiconiux sp.]